MGEGSFSLVQGERAFSPLPLVGATVFEVKSFLDFLPVDKYLTKGLWI